MAFLVYSLKIIFRRNIWEKGLKLSEIRCIVLMSDLASQRYARRETGFKVSRPTKRFLKFNNALY
jgi:hypothetical protein